MNDLDMILTKCNKKQHLFFGCIIFLLCLLNTFQVRGSLFFKLIKENKLLKA